MPDIWVDVDTAIVAPMSLMPIMQNDGLTIEPALVYNFAGIAVQWNFVTTAGVYTAVSITPTTADDHDISEVVANLGLYGIEIPAAAGDANNDTEGFGWITGMATGLLPWRGPTIGCRAAALNNALIDGAYSATRGLAGTALPDAVADAAGGLPISDAGGLDVDTKLANTHEVTAARMAALTDWINGGRLDLILDIIAADTTTDIPALIAALPDAAAINAEVVDALATDTYAEPGQGNPAATTSLSAKINYLYKAWRNQNTRTASQANIYNDAADTIDQKAAISDDATTFIKGEWVTGP